MKKILIVKGKRGKEDALIKYLKKKLEADCQITVDRWSEVIFEIEPGKVKPFLGEEPILGFDLVWLRRTQPHFHYLAKALALVLKKEGIRYLDSAWAENKIGEKFLNYVILALEGLPVPPSFFCLGEKILAKKEKIISNFGLPLIAKNSKKGVGRGVFLIKKEKDLADLFKISAPDDTYLFQKFYPNDGDFRIVVLGGKVWAWEKRTRVKDEFRNNAGLGGKEEFFPLEKIPPNFAKVACKAAKVLGLEIAGVDILVDKVTGKLWILEVNRQPDFTADLKISPELPVVASFIKEILANKNEGPFEKI